MIRFFETIIDPFRPHDVSMPPNRLLRFYWHYTRQVWPALVALMVVGFVVALIEVSLFRYVGSIVDLLKATSPDRVFADYGWTFAWMGFVIVIARPVATIMHDLLVQQTLAPSFTNLVRWQTHRYVLRQTVGFFTNDFAGRIASKIIQTGPALRESVVQVCDALWFVTLYSLTSLFLFAQADWRLTLPLIAWIIAFVVVLLTVVPRIRRRSTIVSEARSMLTGRIVDSYTNIQTVKLFAHTSREDGYAMDAVADHTGKFRRSTRLITLMSAIVVTMNGLLIAGTMALCVFLWSDGILTLGAITLCERPRHPHRHDGRMDHVDLDRHLRQCRRRPGGDGDDRPSAGPRRPPGCGADAGHQGRDLLRPHHLPLRPQGRDHRRPVAHHSGRARRSGSSAARVPASRHWSICSCASTTSRAGAS